MRKLISLLLVTILCLSVAGCGREIVIQQDSEVANDTNGTEEVEAADVLPTNESKPKDESKDGPTDSDIWNQCLAMDDNAVIEEYPKLSIKGVEVSIDWTVEDFLESGIVDDAVSVNVGTLDSTEGMVEMTLDELREGVSGTRVDIIGEDVSLFFDASRTSSGESSGLSALDIPITSMIINDNFDCEGLTPSSTREDVANTFGPTRDGGETLTYQYKDTDGYVDFEFTEGLPMEIYYNIRK